MTKIIDGRKAEITNSLQVYTNWVTLATEHGYPKAAYVYGSDPRSHLNDGDTVTVLTSTFVHDGAMIWVVQARNGEQFLYSGKGLRILPHETGVITVLPDESLGGTLREYREVKRKAAVGELVKVTDKINGNQFPLGEVVRMTSDTRAEYLDNHDWWAVDDSEYVVLEASDILRIDDADGVNRAYRMVDRKAAVGECVIIVSSAETERVGCNFRHSIGETGVVDERCSYYKDRVHVNGWYIVDGDYRVLEPVEPAAPTPEPTLLSAQPAESQAAANIVSLALRLTQAEAKIAALESTIAERKVAFGPVDTTPPSFASLGVMKSAQQIRDEIVERAKADVERLIDECWAAVRVG